MTLNNEGKRPTHRNFIEEKLRANINRGNTTAPIVSGEWVSVSAARSIAFEGCRLAINEAQSLSGQAKRIEFASRVLSGLSANPHFVQQSDKVRPADVALLALVMTDMLCQIATENPNTLERYTQENE
ncbi:MAG: hypothetical protein MJA83_05825 [Gammaproteobacteria bacterium]|nr:hypothetical protein [Gammaproteobacteria bacterium]